MDELRLGPVGQISRRVSDLEAAVGFYGGTLGLPHLYTFGDLAFFDCDGTRLFLSAGGAFDAAAQSIIYFRVTGIHAAHASLEAKGVVFKAPPAMIHRHASGVEEWMAFFEDPDGGVLAIMGNS